MFIAEAVCLDAISMTSYKLCFKLLYELAQAKRGLMAFLT